MDSDILQAEARRVNLSNRICEDDGLLAYFSNTHTSLTYHVDTGDSQYNGAQIQWREAERCAQIAMNKIRTLCMAKEHAYPHYTCGTVREQHLLLRINTIN